MVQLRPDASPSAIWEHEDLPAPCRGGDCTLGPRASAGPDLPPGLTVEFVPSSTTVAYGGEVSGHVVVRNGGDAAAMLDLDDGLSPSHLRNLAGAAVTGVTNAADDVRQLYVVPGDVHRFPVTIALAGCPDATGARPPLAPGDYDVLAGLGVSVGDGEALAWLAGPVRVTVTAA